MTSLTPELVGRRLRRERLRRGLKLRHVARPIGTSVQTLQRLEMGTMTLSVRWLLEVCDVLGISPARMLKKPSKLELEEMEGE